MFISVFVYETLAQCNEERIETSDKLESLGSSIISLLFYTSILPFKLALACVNGLLYGSWKDSSLYAESGFPNAVWPLFELLWVMTEALKLILVEIPVKYLIWNPFFHDLVPKFYHRWNGRVYAGMRSEQGIIRVLRTQEGFSKEDFRYELSQQYVGDSCHPFKALSYSWGRHLVLRRRIKINGCSFFVTHSVYRALESIRFNESHSSIWIDQICINQGDKLDKNQQLPLMAQIYANASSVIVWLGLAPPSLEKAFAALFSSNSTATESENTDLAANLCKALTDLLTRQWWSRVWTVQEISRAGKDTAIIQCGKAELSWTVFARCMSAIKQAGRVQIADSTLQFLAFTLEPQPRKLFEQAWAFKDRQASDPRDKLFGLLGLAEEDTQLVKVDYREHHNDVFAGFSAKVIFQSGHLGIFAFVERNGIDGTPSWAVHWTTSQDATNFRGVNGVPWIKSVAYQRYNACGSYKMVEAQTETSDTRLLRLEGWYVDCIEDTSSECTDSDANITQNLRVWERFAQCHLKGDWKPTFLNCITGGLWDEDYPDSWLQMFDAGLAAQRQGLSLPESQEPDGPVYKNTIECHENTEQTRALKLLHIVSAVCKNRRIFVTKRGDIGIGPPTIRWKDAVCVFASSVTPCILGPAGHEHYFPGDTCFNFNLRYKLRGQAFTVNCSIRQPGDFEDDIRKGRVIGGTILLV